jgi:NAD(P)H dehydrogenase (quinone)
LSTKRLLIIYYTETGNTKLMAELIGEGARGLGVDVEIKRVEECRLEDLVEADGIVVGSPTYFSNIAWQVKKLIDESIVQYRNGHQLRNKVGGCFTSAGTKEDAEDCIRMLELTLGKHHRMKMVPGITKSSDDQWEKSIKACRKYGEEIAEKMK